jgi:hypothetical protein
VRRSLALLLVAVLLSAGCGVRTSKPYTAKGTAPCLRGKGFTSVSTSPAKIGFIASVAANGGLIATGTNGNKLTIAFTDSADDVSDTQDSFTRFAPPPYKAHMADIMETDRNAVLVWTFTPDSQDLDTAKRCLQP